MDNAAFADWLRDLAWKLIQVSNDAKQLWPSLGLSDTQKELLARCLQRMDNTEEYLERRADDADALD